MVVEEEWTSNIYDSSSDETGDESPEHYWLGTNIRKEIVVPHLIVDLNGKKLKAYIDTGASVTLIAHTVLTPPEMLSLRKYDGKVRDASGNKIPIIGEGIAKLITPAGCFKTPVLIYNKTVSVE